MNVHSGGSFNRMENKIELSTLPSCGCHWWTVCKRTEKSINALEKPIWKKRTDESRYNAIDAHLQQFKEQWFFTDHIMSFVYNVDNVDVDSTSVNTASTLLLLTSDVLITSCRRIMWCCSTTTTENRFDAVKTTNQQEKSMRKQFIPIAQVIHFLQKINLKGAFNPNLAYAFEHNGKNGH